MSKRYIGGTVRFSRDKLRVSSVTVQNATLPNFTLCRECDRYWPRNLYTKHRHEEHGEPLPDTNEKE